MRHMLLGTCDFVPPQNIELAVRALHRLNGGLPAASAFKLIVAGGYDERLPEARAYMKELVQLVHELDLTQQVRCA